MPYNWPYLCHASVSRCPYNLQMVFWVLAIGFANLLQPGVAASTLMTAPSQKKNTMEPPYYFPSDPEGTRIIRELMLYVSH